MNFKEWCQVIGISAIVLTVTLLTCLGVYELLLTFAKAIGGH